MPVLARTRRMPPARTMLDVIRGGDAAARARCALRSMAARAKTRPSRGSPRPRSPGIRPCARPGKICAVAMNNSASNERKISAPDHPAFFLKPASCLVGHREPIRIRTLLRQRASGARARRRDRRARRATSPRATRSTPSSATRIFNDITGNGMRAEDRFHYWAVYAKKEQPERDGARRAAPVVRRPLQRHGHVRRDGPVARHEGRDRESRRPRPCTARSAAR